MTLRIHNSLTRTLEPFAPITAGRVRMYVCGITVYDLLHVGHARAMIAFDVVQRWLKASGFVVDYARNITDIDDKIIRRALQNGEPIKALTERMITEMYRDADALFIERPTHDPRATEHVPQMLQMIKTLEHKALAYRSDGGDVNFAVRRFGGYGRLSGKSIDELLAGERVAVADDKRDPLDFVLWKAAKPSEPADAQWPSPWGVGRPGWHIECSAMCKALLGDTVDIHGGGADLQFPHHENELAQSVGANGVPLARIWMHNGFVNIDDQKMSKSLGNFFTVRDVLQRYEPEVLRFFIVRTHYRSPLNYSDAHLDDARGALRRLYTALAEASTFDTPAQIDWTEPRAARFKAALDEDFGTPEAVAVLFELAGSVNRTRSAHEAGLLRALGGVLGLLQAEPRAFLQARALASSTAFDPAAIEALIAERASAKAARDFAAADRIRRELLERGIALKDSAAGTQWEALS